MEVEGSDVITRRLLNRRTLLQTSSVAMTGLLTPWGRSVRAAQDDVTLRVWHVDETELIPINEAFTAAHAGVAIDYQFYPWGEFWDKLNAAYAAGDPPDVHRQDDDELPFFAQRKTLTPMDDYLAGVNQDDLYWNIVELTRSPSRCYRHS